MNINATQKSRYIISLATLICAVFSACVLAYHLLNTKQALKNPKEKFANSDNPSCRLPEQGQGTQTIKAQENTKESELFFAGCAGFF